MKIKRLDKKELKKFKRSKNDFSNSVLCKEIYFYLYEYVKEATRFGFRGFWLCGVTTIKVPDKYELDYLAWLEKILDEEEKKQLIDCYKFMEHIAYILNKYVVVVKDPTYKNAMINYDYMITTLLEAPWFHDAYPVNYSKIGSDLYIRFSLYSSWLSRENRIIYRANPSYQGPNETILITIKFNDVELIEGLLEDEYVLNRDYNFLYDFNYESVEGLCRFDLFEVTNHELIFDCKSIEFIEQKLARVIFNDPS